MQLGNTPEIAKHPFITAGGAKGFLQWMKTDPTMSKVYERIKGKIPALNAQLGSYGDYTTAADGSTSIDATDTVPFSVSPDTSLTSVDFSAPMLDTSSFNLPSNVAVNDSVTASTPAAPASSSWVSSLSNLISAGAQAALAANQVSQAKQVTSLQLQRAAAGQPPLNLSAYGLSTQPGMTVTAGLSSNTMKGIGIVVGGLAGLWLLSTLFGRRRTA